MNRANYSQPQPVAETPTPAAANSAVSVRSFGLTDKGKVRSTNEDHFLIAELARTLWVRQTSLPQQATQYGRNRGGHPPGRRWHGRT